MPDAYHPERLCYVRYEALRDIVYQYANVDKSPFADRKQSPAFGAVTDSYGNTTQAIVLTELFP